MGLGEIFGFKFQENFNYPYSAKSIKDFWRRWHMSLAQFFRDYVYIPLGGSRCRKSRWMLNVMIVWLLTGMWHGASWTYIMWGVLFGIVLIAESFIPEIQNESTITIKNRIISILQHAYTMILICLLWVLFRADSISQSKNILINMLGLGNKKLIDSGFLFLGRNYLIILVFATIFSLPVVPMIKKKYGDNKFYQCGSAILLAVGVLISVSYIYMGSYNPFLYFMF